MDRETRKALKDSIAHWYRISACETKEDLLREGYYADGCALCEMFFLGVGADVCDGCPVKQITGRNNCEGSPYNVAHDSLNKWLHTGEWYNTDQDNIEAEIRFLEGLLEG